jgi:ATP-binding cassette subfamily F protein 3
LLDEPTNHLDFISENILIQALQQYKGSFVVVSHNRHFVSQIANKIWYIENKSIKEYPGTYEEYEYWRKSNPIENSGSKVDEKKSSSKNENRNDTPTNTTTTQLKNLQRELSEVEYVIQQLQTKKTELEVELSKQETYENPNKAKAVEEQFGKVTASLDEMNRKWEKLAVEIDGLSA